MSDLDARADLESRPVERTVSREKSASTWQSAVLLPVSAGILALAAWPLPSLPALAPAETWENWSNFALRILRGTLLGAVVLMLALFVAALSPRLSFRPALLLERLVFRSRSWVFLAVVTGSAAISSAVFACVVMDRTTHIVDETAMLFQARNLAAGRLWAPAPPMPEFFDAEFVIARPPKWYGKYFLGQCIALVPGVWIGMPWLVHPVLIGLAVGLTWMLGRELFNDKAARLAALLMVLSPWRLYTGGVMMAHASSLVMLLTVALGLVKVVRDPRRWGWALVAGTGLGLACNARPLTVIGMGLPMAAAAAWAMPWRRLTARTVLAFAGTLAVFAVVFFAYNAALTGSPLKTAFGEWSATDRLGFGPDVGLEYWPEADKGHSLRRGLLRDMYFNLDALGSSLLGWGQVTIALLVAGTLASPWPKAAAATAAVVAGLIAANVFHVSSGLLMGQPRYWTEALPMMLLLVAAGLTAVRVMLSGWCRMLALPSPACTARSGLWLAGLAAAVAGWWIGHVPLIDICRGFTFDRPQTVARLVAAAGLDKAVVFVRSGHYRTMARDHKPDHYNEAFRLMDPDLHRNRVIYARDLGPAKNAELLKHFPGRTAWWVDPARQEDMELIPLEQAPPLPAG